MSAICGAEMIEQTGRVAEVRSGFAIVETNPRAACGGCRVEGGCGLVGLARLLSQRRDAVRVADHLGLTPGDTVVLGLQAGKLVRAAAAAYGIPLVGLVLGSTLATGVGVPDGGAALAGGAGLLAGLGWLRLRPLHHVRPVLLAREPAAESVCASSSDSVADAR